MTPFIHSSYNSSTNDWVELKPMSIARSHHVSIMVSKRVLLMGGIGNRGTYLNLAEYYDPNNGESVAISPMLQHRSSFTAGIAGDFIYIIGGVVRGDDGIPHRQDTSIERYSIKDDTWTKVIMAYNSTFKTGRILNTYTFLHILIFTFR